MPVSEPHGLPPYEVVLFALAFAALWLIVCALLARLSGWRALAQRFPARDQLGGETFRFASGSLTALVLPVNYSSSLTVTVGPEGLGLAVMLPFRFQAPPLCIPWREVASVEGRSFLGFAAIVRLKGSGPVVKLTGRAGQGVARAWEASPGFPSSRREQPPRGR